MIKNIKVLPKKENKEIILEKITFSLSTSLSIRHIIIAKITNCMLATNFKE